MRLTRSSPARLT
uniref:Uncharacterized protein n=1 Tax=Rhizophora mucronata TaxID=61149 RepID=A0A2P2NY10_RHIMU